MKNLISCIAVIVLVCMVSGCFDSGSDRSKRLKFENASSYGINVISLTTEWSGFYFAPGEVVRFDKIRDVDYRYEPHTRVKEGSASTKRHIVFINIK